MTANALDDYHEISWHSLSLDVVMNELSADENGLSTDEVMKTPMFHLWPKDEACQTIAVEDQFMLDKRWLVCPVVDYNATSRQVYLPKLYGASCHVRSVCI